MFLARREAGKFARVYPLKTNVPPCAWPFDGRHPETGLPTSAAMGENLFCGVCAVHHTRSAAMELLELAELAFIEEFTEVQQCSGS
jgi:hypothetical protein